MNGTAIASEGYVRTVADQGWHLVAVGDYNGDGRADLLWRHASSGDTYVYPMNGTTILAGEGYLRKVPSAWKVVSPLNGGELGGRCDASAAETQVYDSTMAGCGGRVPKASAATLCSSGCHVCTSQEYVAHNRGIGPNAHYWTSDLLYYYGTSGNPPAAGRCSVSPFNNGGSPCMLVTTGLSTDRYGNQVAGLNHWGMGRMVWGNSTAA